MRIGITSPVVVQQPGVHSAWEASAGPEELAEIATAADELGFAHLTCSEHVAIPTEVAAERGATYWDPLATLGYLAAHTRQIRLVTQVLVLGYHHPLQLAKRYGTLDRLSGGRVTLGLGVGSLREEFDLLGAEFEGRGARADDAARALRAALSRQQPQYEGEFYSFSDFVVEPHAVQPEVPLWFGGRTLRSLRRAAAFGQGWVPFGLGPEKLSEYLEKVELPDGFEVVLSPGRPLDPEGDPESTTRKLGRLRDAGATRVTVSLAARDAAHYREQLGALATLADPS